jgi:hypothetical protein
MTVHNRIVSGAWPSGKALDSGSRDRRFESYRPSQEIITGKKTLILSVFSYGLLAHNAMYY